MVKRISLLTVLFLLAGVIAIPSAMAKTEVRVVSWYTSEPGSFLDTLKQAFEAANPDYEIRYETLGSYYDTLQVMLTADAAPDVAMLGFDWIAAMADRGLAMNIDSLVREQFPINEYFPSIQRALQWKGEYYALSRDITSRVFYYNKAHLREAGLSYPGETWTWDQFLSAAKKLQIGAGDETTRWGYSMDFTLDGHFHWYPTNGADWFNFDRTQVTMTNPKTVETMQFLQDLIWVHGVTPNRNQRNAMTNSGRAFVTQKSAMQIGGSATPKPEDYPDLEYGLAMLPQKVQAGTRVWSNLWFIPANTKNPEAAWKVLSFFSGPQGQRIAGKIGGGIPAIRSVALEMKLDPYIVNSFAVGVPYPVISNRAVWDVFNAQLLKMWNNEAPATIIAEEIQRLVAPLMGK